MNCLNDLSSAEFEDFINVDSRATCEETTDELIIENVKNSMQIDEDSETEEEEEIEVSDNESDTNDESIKLYEALNPISLFRKYISQSQNLGSGYEILDSFENIISNNRFINSKQTKMTDFFKL
jgi:hypothetical protein